MRPRLLVAGNAFGRCRQDSEVGRVALLPASLPAAPNWLKISFLCLRRTLQRQMAFLFSQPDFNKWLHFFNSIENWLLHNKSNIANTTFLFYSYLVDNVSYLTISKIFWLNIYQYLLFSINLYSVHFKIKIEYISFSVYKWITFVR